MIGEIVEALGDLLMGITDLPTSRRQWAFVLTMLAAFYVLCFSITMLMESSASGATFLETCRIAPKGLRVAFFLALAIIPFSAAYGWPSRSRR